MQDSRPTRGRDERADEAPKLFQGDVDVLSSDDSAFDSDGERRRKNQLGKLSRRKLEAMLRCVQNTRENIARIMVFALDRPNAAEEVVDVMTQSLLIPSTPVPRKVARLNAISDILHNCAGNGTNAWKYRVLFESRLPQVFTHLGEIYKSFPGRMKAEVFRKQIMNVVQVWENWLVFTPTVLADLEKRLSTGDEGAASREGSTGTDDNAAAAPHQRGPGAAMRTGFSAVKTGATDAVRAPAAAAAAADEDLDGEEIAPAADEDLDGEPLDGEDIDGAPL